MSRYYNCMQPLINREGRQESWVRLGGSFVTINAITAAGDMLANLFNEEEAAPDLI